MDRTLTAAERRALLRLARASIEEELKRDGSLERALHAVELTPALLEPRACFATLKAPAAGGKEWRLRGCVGGISPRQPLYRSAIQSAAEAAFRDPRFPPLRLEELAEVRLSLSVLSGLRPVTDPEDIEPGTHGVVLEKSQREAVFLPQVAIEQGWDRWQLLEHLSLKAGLGREAWRGARLWTFEAETFSEEPGEA